MFAVLMRWLMTNKMLPQISDTERQALEQPCHRGLNKAPSEFIEQHLPFRACSSLLQPFFCFRSDSDFSRESPLAHNR